MKDPYIIYVECYGKVQSGVVLSKKDYGELGSSFTPFDEKGTLAVSLAAQDVKNGILIRSKKDFEDQIKNLLE